MTHANHLIYALEPLILILNILFMDLFTIIQSDVHNLFIYEYLKATGYKAKKYVYVYIFHNIYTIFYLRVLDLTVIVYTQSM